MESIYGIDENKQFYHAEFNTHDFKIIFTHPAYVERDFTKPVVKYMKGRKLNVAKMLKKRELYLCNPVRALVNATVKILLKNHG